MKNDTVSTEDLMERIKLFSKEQNIPEINEYNKTSMYDTFQRRYQPTEFDAKDFESIAGMPATKSSVEEAILKPWLNADKLRKAKIQLPAGGVFAGDPGTSKTYMAKAIARSLEIPLYVLKMSDIGSSYVHETSRNIGKIVDQLIQKFDETGEASVLLIDEIDHFQKIRANQALKKLILFFKKLNGVEIKFFSLEQQMSWNLFQTHLQEMEEWVQLFISNTVMQKAAKEILKNLLKRKKG